MAVACGPRLRFVPPSVETCCQDATAQDPSAQAAIDKVTVTLPPEGQPPLPATATVGTATAAGIASLSERRLSTPGLSCTYASCAMCLWSQQSHAAAVSDHLLRNTLFGSFEQVLGAHDLLKLVLGKISLIDLCAATTVCRQWRDVARSDDFWSDVDFEAPVREEQARGRDGSDRESRGVGSGPGSSRWQQQPAEHGSRRVMAHQVLIAAASQQRPSAWQLCSSGTLTRNSFGSDRPHDLLRFPTQVAAVTHRHPGIRKLNVKGVEWPEGTLRLALGVATKLEVLRLGGASLSESTLAVLGALTTLRRLDIQNATLGRYGPVRAPAHW